MVAVIEAGGSKTDFRFGNSTFQQTFSGKGINPYFQDEEEIHFRISEVLQPDKEFPRVNEVFYYGAGCSGKTQKDQLLSILNQFFPESRIEVESDLLGAARALCRHSYGFVGILGTGSNACLFDGTNITREMVSFGFWLGDEGSGGFLGKLLFKEWLKGNLPVGIEEEFRHTFGSSKENALQQLYQSKNPNSLVASLAAIGIRNKEQPLFQKLIQFSLHQYFEETSYVFSDLPDLVFHFTGSVAWHLKEEIQKEVEKRGYKTGIITANPSEHLFEFHILSNHTNES